MKNIISSPTVLLGAVIVAATLSCQKNTFTDSVAPTASIGSYMAKGGALGLFTSNKSLGLRFKVEQARRLGWLKKTAEVPEDKPQNPSDIRVAASTAADRGCGKLSSAVTTFVADGYDETADIKIGRNNWVDYVDYKYSDDPTAGGRMKFDYSSDSRKVTISFITKAGETISSKDIITLNEKGYATEWLHDLTNFSYDKPYIEKMEYNAAGRPTRFVTVYEGQTLQDFRMTYTKEGNFDRSTDAISGNVATYTSDLTRPQVISLINWPVWYDFSKFYGENLANNITKIVVQDKAGKILSTSELKYEFLGNTNSPSKITRLEEGKPSVMFDKLVYDCKNYNVSQPRRGR